MKIPKGWHQITIHQFQELLPSKMDKHEGVAKTIHQLHILTEEPKEKLWRLTNSQLQEIKKQLAFLSTERPNHLKTKYKINGQRYKFEVNALNTTAQEYISVMEVLKGLNANPETVEQNLHSLLALVSRPIKWNGKVRDDYQVTEMAKQFEHHMTMDIANPIIVFFCNLSKHLTKVTNDYSMQKVIQAEEAVKDLKRTAGL